MLTTSTPSFFLSIFVSSRALSIPFLLYKCSTISLHIESSKYFEGIKDLTRVELAFRRSIGGQAIYLGFYPVLTFRSWQRHACVSFQIPDADTPVVPFIIQRYATHSLFSDRQFIVLPFLHWEDFADPRRRGPIPDLKRSAPMYISRT